MRTNGLHCHDKRDQNNTVSPWINHSLFSRRETLKATVFRSFPHCCSRCIKLADVMLPMLLLNRTNQATKQRGFVSVWCLKFLDGHAAPTQIYFTKFRQIPPRNLMPW